MTPGDNTNRLASEARARVLIDRQLADACVADSRWSFLLTVAPLTIMGGVVSPANAIALR